MKDDLSVTSIFYFGWTFITISEHVARNLLGLLQILFCIAYYHTERSEQIVRFEQITAINLSL